MNSGGFGLSSLIVQNVITLANVFTEGRQLIEATSAQSLSNIPLKSIQFPHQLHQGLRVALMNLVEQLIGINSFNVSASLNE